MSIKGKIVSLGIASIISTSNAASAQSSDSGKFQTKIYEVIADGNDRKDVKLNNAIEMQKYIDAKIVTDAALNYFDEEVRFFQLEGGTRQKVESILMNYLSLHPILYIGDDKNLVFEIDDKSEFSKMIKDITYTLLWGMPDIRRKFAIIFVFGGEEKLEYQLDNLGESIYNMKLKQYKNMVFDYVGGIVKRVEGRMGGNLTIGKYYEYVDNYFPNKHSNDVKLELNRLNYDNVYIVQMKYPFKK